MPLMGQYEYIIDKTHHKANSEGQVYVHIIVVEAKLGRKLKNGEVVHHIDGNKLNNSPDNLLVFHTKSDHTAFHLNNCDISLIAKNSDGSYSCRKKQYICQECGQIVTKSHEYCNVCAMKLRRKCDRPSKNELYQIILDNNGNFSKIAKLFDLTDNTIRQWCKDYNMPYKSSDYK